MQMKKILAVVMSLCMVAGAVSYGAPVITQSITAQAAETETYCYSFDETTGTLTLKGEIDSNALRSFNTKYNLKVKSVTAEKGTVFPENCSNLFYYYRNCTNIDLSKVNTSKVTNMRSMFSGCSVLIDLDVSSFKTSKVTDMSNMFSYCSSLTTLDLSTFDTSNVTDMNNMFSYCSGLTTLDLSAFNTGNVTDMNNMFGSCVELTSIDLSSFDTSKVTKMNDMFYSCPKLASLDLSSFNTSKVTKMNHMFYYCSGLTELDVSGFDTSNVTTMGSLFHNCSKLTSLDLSSFDTSNVEFMHGMFCNCIGLTELDLSGFDTSSIRDMNYMFDGCVNLTSLDLSSFDTSKGVNMTVTFRKCDNLKTLSLGENFKSIEEGSELTNGIYGWININSPKTVVSGSKKYAIIYNEGKNTYKRLPIEEEAKPTYPTNIKVEYSAKFHQVRFTWDKVEGADRYGVAVYLAGKWRVQTQNITGTVYTSPKNLTPGKTYKVAIAARVNGKWDTANAIKNAVTITIK
ncbi:cell surface protein [Ruminococcus albus SY3]|uniref:Cell surface protein n=1 Tax=Ruminococcus albus SY3 TaxID=1341156 RepID=A0A011VQV2_RUMAL|nr:BspA family leucine-rich repeat surface protein [Ruminococcus albus]EXM37631.1 cell surface protein [Ruminococcus albus SY3]